MSCSFPFVFQRCKKVQFLITTGDGKFYSNGLDQVFLKTCTTEEFLETFNLLNRTIIRFMTFPVLTVAAINGILQLVDLRFLSGSVSSQGFLFMLYILREIYRETESLYLYF